jgi:uncharacterized membrane protein
MLIFIGMTALAAGFATMFMYNNLPDDKKEWAVFPIIFTVAAVVLGVFGGLSYETWLFAVCCGYNKAMVTTIIIAVWVISIYKLVKDFLPSNKPYGGGTKPKRKSR